MGRLYALLVGINAYEPPTSRLGGCLNDVENFHDFLKDSWPAADLAVEFLCDAEATRANVMRQFRAHLGQAGPSDTAVFHYCGHGSRAPAAPEFAEYFAEGKDETLFCFDSGRAGGQHLADKELAVLIRDVASRDPHVAILLDCCHSGSGTRDIDDLDDCVPRQTREGTGSRALESYADGYYAARKSRGEPLSIPGGRHILLSACERFQTAKETQGRGVFTTALVRALRSSAEGISYPELFMRVRAAAREMAREQDPQFETAGGFDGWSGFLGRGGVSSRRRYYVAPDAGGWSVECGAIHGLVADPDRPATFAIYGDAGPALGHATARAVGAQRSEIALDFTPAPDAPLRAEITSLPAPPMLVGFHGEAALKARLAEALAEPSADPVALTEAGQDAAHQLRAEDGALVLRQRGTGLVIQRIRLLDDGSWLAPTLAAMRHVARWERRLALANPRPKLDPGLVDFRLETAGADGGAGSDTEPVVRIEKRDGAWQRVPGKLKVGNGSDQMLHMALAYFGADYGVTILRNDQIPAGARDVTLWGDGPDDDFRLGEDEAESVERFKLIVSTEKIDDFLLAQDPMALGGEAGATRGIGSVARAPLRSLIDKDWFTRDMPVRLVGGCAPGKAPPRP